MPRACITGITGQDGSYLAELLLSKGYEVHGLVRHVALEDASTRLSRIAGLQDRIHLHGAAIENFASTFSAIEEIQPDELYHLAAQSFVGYSFEDGFATFGTNINGTHHVLEAVRQCVPACRVFFAASSEMFGKVLETPQSENTPFYPRSPYGITKVTGFHLCRNYREAYGLFVASGILFNHESPRRGSEFVTRKITWHAARIKAGLLQELSLGNLAAKRDWGYAPDYVEAMYLMLQQDEPDDYVIATGETHSVQEFCELAFGRVGLDYRKYVRQQSDLLRPTEVQLLLGNAAKAREKLGWVPRCKFPDLVNMMVDHDLSLLL